MVVHDTLAIFRYQTVNNKKLPVRFYLELVERLLTSWSLGNLENVEANSLGERSALANSDNIANLHVSVIAHDTC